MTKKANNALIKLKPLTLLHKKRPHTFICVLSDQCIHNICESIFNLLYNTYNLNDKTKIKVRNSLNKIKSDIK